MNITFKKTRLAHLLGLALLAAPLASHAQEAQQPAADAAAAPAADTATTDGTDKAKDKQVTTLEKVTITADRRAKPLQTTSISASVLSGDDLLKAGVDIVDQLQFVTPSTAANNFGQGVNITIRGIGKAETNTQTTTGVITYRDGVATFPGYLSTEPYYDIASVQILRGPQGTFGGQNATGGAILVESNNPIINGGVHGYAAASAGNYSMYGTQAAVNLPVNDTFAMRVAFNTYQRDSFWTITGPYTGGDGSQNWLSGRVGALWKPSKALSVLLKTDFNRIDMGAYPADPVNSTNDPFHITANAPQKALDKFNRTTLKVEYTFDDGTKFRSVTGHQYGDSAYKADLDGTATDPRNWSFKDRVEETINSQEFNLISPDNGALTWVLGLYGQKDLHDFPTGEFVTGVPAGNVLSEYRLDGRNPVWTLAAFGQVGYKLTNDLKLSVEGRYSRNGTRNEGKVSQYGLPLDITESAHFKNFSGKIALDWTIDKDNFVYGFLASGYRPGGLNVPVGLGLPPPFKEEKVRSAELGWKASWMDGHVLTQTSAFYNQYRNFQVTIGYPQYPTFGFELNTPNPTKMYGFEGSVQAMLGDGWSAKANVGFLHSQIGLFYATDPRAASILPCDPLKGPSSISCINLDGHEQTYAPNMTFNLSLEKRFNIGDDTITPRINYAHVGKQWATLFENRARSDELGARDLLGASVDWERGDFSASIFATNLTNKKYLAAIGSGLRYAGAPRQYGVRITKFF
ncbi:TonB-dependent receptor [Burkholderiaceae bacterium UC74_6]